MYSYKFFYTFRACKNIEILVKSAARGGCGG